jgi:hypothetical protein
MPTGSPVARSRATQFSQPSLPSGEWPAACRANRARSSSSVAGSPPV